MSVARFTHGQWNFEGKTVAGSDRVGGSSDRVGGSSDRLGQRFSNFFPLGTTFISQNVLRTTLLLGLSNSLGLP